MADFDDVLKRELAPVAAPDDLWAAIHRPRAPQSRRFSLEWAFWPVATVMLMLALAGMLRSYTLTDGAGSLPVASASAQGCHTPVYAVNDMRNNPHYILAVSGGHKSQEACLSCHFSLPGMLVLSARP